MLRIEQVLGSRLDPAFAAQMQAADDIMHADREILRQLAK